MSGTSTPGTHATFTAVQQTLAKSRQSIRDSLKLEGFPGIAERMQDIVPKGSDRYERAVKRSPVPILKLGSYETQSQEVSYRSEIELEANELKHQLDAEHRRCKGLESTVKNLKEELRELERARADSQALNFRLKGMYDDLELEKDLKFDIGYSFTKEKAYIEQTVLQTEQLRADLTRKQQQNEELERRLVEVKQRAAETEAILRQEVGELKGVHATLKLEVELKDKEIAMMQRRLDSVEEKALKHGDRFIELSRLNADKQFSSDKARAELEDFKGKYDSLLKEKEVEEKRLRIDLEAQRHFCMQLSSKLKDHHTCADRQHELQSRLRETTLKCEKLEFLYSEQLKMPRREAKENRTRKVTPTRTAAKTPLRSQPRTTSTQRRRCSGDFDDSINKEGLSELVRESQAQLGLSRPLSESRCPSCLGVQKNRPCLR